MSIAVTDMNSIDEHERSLSDSPLVEVVGDTFVEIERLKEIVVADDARWTVGC